MKQKNNTSRTKGKENISAVVDDSLHCDLCSRAFKSTEIFWDENKNIRLCADCGAEEESCGCSDD